MTTRGLLARDGDIAIAANGEDARALSFVEVPERHVLHGQEVEGPAPLALAGARCGAARCVLGCGRDSTGRRDLERGNGGKSRGGRGRGPFCTLLHLVGKLYSS